MCGTRSPAAGSGAFREWVDAPVDQGILLVEESRGLRLASRAALNPIREARWKQSARKPLPGRLELDQRLRAPGTGAFCRDRLYYARWLRTVPPWLFTSRSDGAHDFLTLGRQPADRAVL